MRTLLLLFILSINSMALERIIALSPAINEIIFALGAGDEVVGNTDYCTYPIQSKLIPKVGGYFNPNIEKILTLQPTIAIMQKHNLKLSKQLNKLGIATKIIQIDRLENIRASILELGKILHREKNATKIVRDINSSLDSIKGIVKDKKILIVIGHNTSLVKQVFVVGQNLYLNDIINISGNINAFQSKRRGQPILNYENIIHTNPDIVILLAHGMKQRGLKPNDLIKPWENMPIKASKNHQIYIIDKEYAGIPSDRLVLFLRDFKRILNEFKNR